MSIYLVSEYIYKKNEYERNVKCHASEWKNKKIRMEKEKIKVIH